MKKGFGLSLFFIVLMVAAAGVLMWKLNEPDSVMEPSEVREASRVEVDLYFGDDQAMYLVPEKRTITLENDKIIEVVMLEELIIGPKVESHLKTIPENSRVLSVRIEDKVAFVDLSKQFQTEHWGGSTGDLMTTYSIVNTLAALPHIDAVQLLLEGLKHEAILGHLDTTEPIPFNTQIVK